METEEQRKLQEQAVKDQVNKIEAEKNKPPENIVVDNTKKESEFLTQAKALREGQAQLIEERTRLESEKKEFKKLMSDAEVAGKSLAGDAVVKEPTKDEVVTADAKKVLAGTGFEDRIG